MSDVGPRATAKRPIFGPGPGDITRLRVIGLTICNAEHSACAQRAHIQVVEGVILRLDSI